MTANFTPGPYCDNGDGYIRQAEQNEGSRLFIAMVIDIPFNFGGDKVTEANINLLKAAPDLYTALEEAQECMRKLTLALPNDFVYPSEFDPQGWHEALAKAGRA